MRRALLIVVAVPARFFVAQPVLFAYAVTHIQRAEVPADTLGVPHQDVGFTTSDGLRLHGWYIPSRNGAAVVDFPGRLGTQAHARMLARHGYGVLLFDRRGEGSSEGAGNMLGWGGDKALLEAAVALFSDTAPPATLTELVPQIAPRQLLFIWAPDGGNATEVLTPQHHRIAGSNASLWAIPNAKHIKGIEEQPRAYEHRVVTFFDHALLDR